MFRLRKGGLASLVVALSSFFGVQVQAQPLRVIVAGDYDNFGVPEAATMRGPLATWLAREGGVNRGLHNASPMPFDMDTNEEATPFNPAYPRPDNWDFGYSFTALSNVPENALLRIRLKAVGGLSYTDFLQLQFYENPPRFSYGVSLNELDGFSGGNGRWSFGEVAVFDLPLGNLPGNGFNLIPEINATQYLDVVVMDDTAVDWIEVVVPEPGSLSLLLLGALPLVRRRS